MLLILGLDGATLDLVEPWIADGDACRTSRACMRDGAWGRLASTVPAATFPSWTTFMTGVNPGRHGVLRLHPPRARRVPRALRQRDLPQGADDLAAAERRRPAGQRPRPARHLSTRADQRLHGQRLRHPGDDARRRQLRPSAGVRRRGGGRRAASRSPTSRSSASAPGWHARARAGGCATASTARCALAEPTARRANAWDCLMLLFGESDTAAHHFWALHDRALAAPRRRRSAAALGDPLRTRLHRARRRRRPTAGDGARGDGAGGFGSRLRRRRHDRRAPQPLARASRAMLRFAPRGRRRALGRARCARPRCGRSRSAGRRAASVSATARLASRRRERRALRRHRLVARTRAFSEELNYFPVDLAQRARDATAAARCRSRDYGALCAALRAALLAWRDPHPPASRWWRASGIATSSTPARAWRSAPDLVLELATPGGYSYVGVPSYGADGPAVERAASPPRCGGKLRRHERQPPPRRPVHAERRAGAAGLRRRRADRRHGADHHGAVRRRCARRLGRAGAGGAAPRAAVAGGADGAGGGRDATTTTRRRARSAAPARAAGVPGMNAPRRYRVAVVAACPFPSLRGSQVLVRELAEGLAHGGHAVHVVTYPTAQHLAPVERIAIHRVRKLPGLWTAHPFGWQKVVLDLLLAWTLLGVVRRERIEVIHAHNVEAPLVAFLVRWLTGVPVVYHAHNALADELPCYFRARAARAVWRADRRVPRPDAGAPRRRRHRAVRSARRVPRGARRRRQGHGRAAGRAASRRRTPRRATGAARRRWSCTRGNLDPVSGPRLPDGGLPAPARRRAAGAAGAGDPPRRASADRAARRAAGASAGRGGARRSPSFAAAVRRSARRRTSWSARAARGRASRSRYSTTWRSAGRSSMRAPARTRSRTGSPGWWSTTAIRLRSPGPCCAWCAIRALARSWAARRAAGRARAVRLAES